MTRRSCIHRYIRKHRCSRCAMLKEQCLCTLVRPIASSTRIIIVAHSSELGKTSNTARLVRLVVPSTEIIAFGGLPDPSTPGQVVVEGEQYRCARTLTSFAPEDNAFLLFPDANARTLTLETKPQFPTPLTLVVPDGNWAQARKISQRHSVLAALPRIKVPTTGPSLFTVRRAPHSEVLCTLEAIAAALEVLEGTATKDALLGLLQTMVERTMKLRGYRGAAPNAPETSADPKNS